MSGGTNGVHRPTKADMTGDPECKPTTLTVLPSHIPEVLRNLDRWVAWRWIWNGKKWTKPPVNARTGAPAKSNDQTTWCDDKTALAFYQDGRADGIGIVLGDGFVGVDLDECRNLQTGVLEAWAAKITRDLDTYTEVSPTGTGVKIFLKANLPQALKSQQIEIYSSGRYFTCTGHRLETAPADCKDRQAQLDALMAKLRESKQSVQRNGQHERRPSPPDRDRTVALEALRHLAPARCDEYGRWIDVGQALHSVGADLLPAWDDWSKGSAKYVPGECDVKWRGFHADGGLTLGSLLFWARQDTGWVPQQGATAGSQRSTTAAKANMEVFQVGDLMLVLDSARRTPTKLIVEVEVRNPAGPIDRLTLTSTAAGRKEFVHSVRRLVGETADAEVLAGKLLAAAAAHAQNKAPIDGPTVRQIVAEKVPPVFRLAYRADKGAWSEARGCEITRAEFIGFTPGWLIDSCKIAADFQGEMPDEMAVLRAVEAALKITWATLVSELPHMESADLQRDSEAAKRFRSAVIKLWSRPFAGESIVRPNGEEVHLRASLRSRVVSQLRRHRGTSKWDKIHPAYSAWWRERCGEDGEVQIYLSMRYELTAEGQVEIPGCDSQVSLGAMGTKFGAIDPSPPVPTKLSRGTARLAILTRELTDYLLAEPSEGDEAGDAERPPVSPAVIESDGFAAREGSE